MKIDKSRIQSCVDHINTAVDVDPWAKELVAEMGKEILKAQLSGEDATSDCISRQAVRFIESNSDSYPEEWNDDYEKGFTDALNKVIALPSVQPDIIVCADCKHWVCHDRRCGYWNHGVKPLEWCCHAERRTDDHESNYMHVQRSRY